VLGGGGDDEADRNSGHTPFTPRAPGFNFTASASRFGGGGGGEAAAPPAAPGWWDGGGVLADRGDGGGGGGESKPAAAPGGGGGGRGESPALQFIQRRPAGDAPPAALATAVTFDPNGLLDASSGRFACAAAEAAAAEAAAAEAAAAAAAAAAPAASGLRPPTALQTTSTESACAAHVDEGIDADEEVVGRLRRADDADADRGPGSERAAAAAASARGGASSAPSARLGGSGLAAGRPGGTPAASGSACGGSAGGSAVCWAGRGAAGAGEAELAPAAPLRARLLSEL